MRSKKLKIKKERGKKLRKRESKYEGNADGLGSVMLQQQREGDEVKEREKQREEVR